MISPADDTPRLTHPLLPSPLPVSAGGAIVIGGDYRGLGIARALGRRGISVWILRDFHSVAAYSRYASRVLPWPHADECAQLRLLIELATQLDGEKWTLFPTGDETTALLARNHGLLSQAFIVSTGPWDAIETAYDKRRTYTVAESLGVPIPWTRYLVDGAELEFLDCSFPVIVKPAIKEGLNPLTHAKAWRVDSRADLLLRYQEACSFMSPDLLMIQEMIPGGGDTQFSFAGLIDSGEPVVTVVARRARQYPMEFGHHSTYVVSVENPRVEDIARRVLSEMKYSGLVEVEFKYDARVDEYKLLDINARVWGWHTMGRKQSLDFSYELWRYLHGETIDPRRLPPGLQWMRALTDIPSSLQQLGRGQLRPWSYLRSWLGSKEFAIMAKDDAIPALVDLPLLTRLSLRRKAL